jgi:hypothetical protein
MEIDPQRWWRLHVKGEPDRLGPLVGQPRGGVGQPHLSSSRVDLWRFVFYGGLEVLGVGFIVYNFVLLM